MTCWLKPRWNWPRRSLPEAEPAVSKENLGEQVKAPAAKIASAPDMPNGGLEELVENAQEQRETAESTAGRRKRPMPPQKTGSCR